MKVMKEYFEIPKFCSVPPSDFCETVDETICYRELGAFRNIKDDLLTTAYRKYTVDWFRRKRKHRKMYKFFIKLNK